MPKTSNNTPCMENLSASLPSKKFVTLLETWVVLEEACKIGICAFSAASISSLGGSNLREIIKHGVSGVHKSSITSYLD